MTGATTDQAFDAVVDVETRVLVLGSFPGAVSLRERRYYAHPQNQFWALMSAVTDVDLAALDYAGRLAALVRAHVGLWDVIASATRAGSLDSAIRAPQVRDLPKMVARLPRLRAIAFNGGAALRHGVAQIGEGASVPLVALPSSSAAHTIGIAAKRPAWERLRAYLG